MSTRTHYGNMDSNTVEMNEMRSATSYTRYTIRRLCDQCHMHKGKVNRIKLTSVLKVTLLTELVSAKKIHDTQSPLLLRLSHCKMPILQTRTRQSTILYNATYSSRYVTLQVEMLRSWAAIFKFSRRCILKTKLLQYTNGQSQARLSNGTTFDDLE